MHRTIALAERDDAVAVAGDLHLDMASRRDEPLYEQALRPEAALGLRGGASEGLVEFGEALDGAHSPAAAAVQRLQHDRRPALRGEKRPRFVERDGALDARRDRYAPLHGKGPRPRFVAKQRQELR